MALLFNKIFTIVLIEYFNYNNIFSAKITIKLLEHIGINNYIIKLEKDKQLFFKFIYNLKPIELKILKIYIKTNLANSFIQLFKSFVNISILFDLKLDKSLHFCINY